MQNILNGPIYPEWIVATLIGVLALVAIFWQRILGSSLKPCACGFSNRELVHERTVNCDVSRIPTYVDKHGDERIVVTDTADFSEIMRAKVKQDNRALQADRSRFMKQTRH